MAETQAERSRRYRQSLLSRRDRLASIEADLVQLHSIAEAFLASLERILGTGLCDSGKDDSPTLGP